MEKKKKKRCSPISLPLSSLNPSILTGSRHALGNREPAGPSPGDDEVDQAARRRVEGRELEIVVPGVVFGRAGEKALFARRRRRIGDSSGGDGRFRRPSAERSRRDITIAGCRRKRS